MAVNLSKTNHPSYPEMLYEAISKSKNKQGCSRADILNFITKKYQLESRKQVSCLCKINVTLLLIFLGK